MIKQVKSGYLLHHKKRLFGKAWREEFVVLYEDSSVIWFRDRDRLDPEGGLFLRDSPEMLAAGQWVNRVPNKPELPNGCDLKLCIAMGSRHREKVHWFICKSESELIDWMSAINKTLPPPPPPPEELRDSRRNLSDKNLICSKANQENYPPPPRDYEDPADLSDRISRLALRRAGFTDRTRSYSAGRLNALRTTASGYPPLPVDRSISRQMSFHENSMSNKGYSVSDVTSGVLMGGVLTQWNAGPNCWDWGMGWGFTGWNAAFCGTCAMEQMALANHVPTLINAPPQATESALGFSSQSGASDYPGSSSAQFYFDDDHELGELGETADVGCDFGDFGF